MKLLATLLIMISLAVGLTSASSAYLADLSRPDGQLIGLTLNEDVSVLLGDGRTRATLAKRGAELDPQRLAELRAASVNRVRVEEFGLGRWNERYIFLLALLGLGGGAFLTRRAAAQAIAAQHHALGNASDRRSPAGELSAIAGIVEELLAAWVQRAPGGMDARYVLGRLAAAIEEHGPAFVASRELLVARMGLGGYASLMDRFAGAERQLHRAWSAAADGVLEETHVCLERARVVLEEARAALGSAGA
jgi:hypothetical protein